MEELLKRTIERLNSTIENQSKYPIETHYERQRTVYNDGKISALLDVIEDMAAALGMAVDIDPLSGHAYVYTPKSQSDAG